MIAGRQTGLTMLADDGKNTISSQIVLRLRAAIVSGELPAGSKINLEQLRFLMQVSLSPLREALARLIADGLVAFEDNRGYRVAPVSREDFEEVVRLRLQFETFALREAIARGDLGWESDVMRALHLVNRTERDAARPETLEAWETAHRGFHLALISGCGLPKLLAFCTVLLNLHERYRRIFLQQTAEDRDVIGEHAEIARAATARDAGKACDGLEAHLSRTAEELLRHLAGTLPAKANLPRA